jgi:hypothetical protein
MKATSNMKKVQPLNLRNQLHHNHLQQPFAATSSTHPVKKKKKDTCAHMTWDLLATASSPRPLKPLDALDPQIFHPSSL